MVEKVIFSVQILLDVTIIKKIPSEHVNYNFILHIYRPVKPNYFTGCCKYHSILDASNINTVFPLICVVSQENTVIYKRCCR